MTRLRGTEAGPPPASDLAALFRAHGAKIAALPVDLPDLVDDGDEVWIETLATAGPIDIPHTETDDDTTIDWSH